MKLIKPRKMRRPWKASLKKVRVPSLRQAKIYTAHGRAIAYVKPQKAPTKLRKEE